MERRITRSSAAIPKTNYCETENDKNTTDDSEEDSGEETLLNFNQIINEEKSDTEMHVEESLENAATKYFGTSLRKKRLSKKRGEDSSTSKNEEDDDEFSIDIPINAVRNWLRDADEDLPSFVKDLFEKYRSQYSQWLLYLSEGFNILLHGYGSKINLLNDFCSEKLSGNYNYMIIRGYLPTLRLKDVLVNLAESLNITLEPFSNVISSARFLIDEINNLDDVDDVVLVIYNIDGPNLRDDTSQTVFSLLAETKNIHIIASVDNVNASILWDLKKTEKFLWIYFDTPTYRSYVEEIISTGNSKILGLNAKKSSNLHNLSSLQSVWASLTDNARQVFMFLARKQLDVSSKSTSCRNNVTFWDLYKICRDEFVVSTEAALHQQMVEFEDHHLVIKRTAPDGGEILELAVEENVLKDFVQQQQSQ